MNSAVYLLCASFNDYEKGKGIIKQFLKSDNKEQAKLLLIENGAYKNYLKYQEEFEAEKSVRLFFSKSPNKSKCLNNLINDKITEKEALIICIDNDIEFKDDFIARYKKTAFRLGKDYYFGGGLIVPVKYSKLIDKDFKKLYQGSQFSRTDEDFKKMKSLMFFGANFAFFKSQWFVVNGFDERFAPGSKYGLAGQEAVFQKKLKYVDFKPFFVNTNEVIHYPEVKSYTLDSIKKRTLKNGFTHGFQKLINSTRIFKYDYLYKLGGIFKAVIKFKLKQKKPDYIYKKQYCLGYLKAFFLYLKIENRKTIFYGLKNEVATKVFLK